MTFALDSRVRDLAVRIGDDIQGLQADVAVLLGSIGGFDDDLAALDAEVDALTTRVATLETSGGGGAGGGYTQAEADAKFVDSAELETRISALVGVSPAALDTLAEIATALGDDPNFAATITGQLALKLNASAVSTFALTLLDDTSASAMRTTLGLGALATKATAATADISNDAVSNTKLANMPALTIKGNNTASTADPIDLTVTQVKTTLSYVIGDLPGLRTELDGKMNSSAAGAFGGQLLATATAAAARTLLEVSTGTATDTDYVALYNTARTTV